jgi:hypothetical protein
LVQNFIGEFTSELVNIPDFLSRPNVYLDEPTGINFDCQEQSITKAVGGLLDG